MEGGEETGSQVERTCGKLVAGGPGQARLHLAGKAAAGGLGNRGSNPPEFQPGEIKPQTTENTCGG